MAYLEIFIMRKVSSATRVCRMAPLAYHSTIQEQCLLHKVMVGRSGSVQLIWVRVIIPVEETIVVKRGITSEGCQVQ